MAKTKSPFERRGEGAGAISQCAACALKHKDRATCTAFPSGIPAAILANRFDHRKEYPDQERPGYVFRLRDNIDPDRLEQFFAPVGPNLQRKRDDLPYRRKRDFD